MGQEQGAKTFRCERCGAVYTSLMRLQHHRAAEHAPRTLKDILTGRDIAHNTGKR